jgi:hypothetical protein
MGYKHLKRKVTRTDVLKKGIFMAIFEQTFQQQTDRAPLIAIINAQTMFSIADLKKYF